MAETGVEKAVCEKCGADVRENTAFCYSCGESILRLESDTEKPLNVDVAVNEETQSALDDLAERLKLDEDAENKLARAAGERKKARVKQRKPNEFQWESNVDKSAWFLVVVSVLITTIVGLVVFFTVFWR